jgi:hypothetical protein
MFLSLFRFVGRSAHGLGFRLFCGFHLKNKLRSHIVVQLDRDLMFAGIFDRTLENNFVPIDLRADFVLEAVHDVLRCD